MDNGSQTLSWTDQAIFVWTSAGIKLQDGASSDKISDCEKMLDFKFPQDFIELYSHVNGFEDFDWNENMFSLWSLDRILTEYQEFKDQECIGICDFLINSHSFGFRRTDKRIHKYWGTSSEVVAATFQDFIHLLNVNANLLY